VVLNAKLVTSLDFARIVDFHREEEAAMTVGAMEYGVQIPYGVLRLDGPQVTAIDEKPTLRTLCSAGIYVLSPEVVDLVPRNTFFGMPELIDEVMRRGDKVVGFPVLEKIINISTREELEEALLYFATGEEI
jgi:NDP-sugar pyrophosphorylase family protein